MALAPLATVDDLTARNIDATDPLASTMLAVASAAVREAAGSPISQTESTVDLIGRWCEPYLRLPGPPVVSVSKVLIEGVEVTDWRLVGDRLWRCQGWAVTYGPNRVTVTYTHGLPEVPDDVVDLVCSLAGAGVAAAAESYAAHGGVVAERIDDYSVTYAQGADAVASVMELPEGTRNRLRARFGGSARLVRSA